jgi:hypothetical protein
MDNFGLSTPSLNLQGAFNTYKPDEPIPANLYGLLAQLEWFGGTACVPVAHTNALAGMAAWYGIPEMLINGGDQHARLLGTFRDLAEKMNTNTGTTIEDEYLGLTRYLESQGVAKNFSVTLFKEKSDNNGTLFTDLISAFAKGTVIFSDIYKGGEGGHALTGVKYELDDRNNNMIIDKGEAYALVIDPLNPSKDYSPNSINRSGLSDEAAEELWNTTIKAAPNSLPNLQRVEIYQDFNSPEAPGSLAFDYDQSTINISEKDDTWKIDISQATKAEGNLFEFVGLQYSSLPGNLDALIAPAQSNEVIFDFSDFISSNNKVTAELFSYFNESSSLANKLSFYQLADDQGTIVDPVSGARLTPGADGYREAALKQAQIFEASDRVSADDDLDGRISQDAAQMGSFSFELKAINGTALFAPIVTTSDGVVWTTFAEANQDGLDHFQWQGGLSFKMEDQPGLGDRDFNDLQVVLTPLEINGIS